MAVVWRGVRLAAWLTLLAGMVAGMSRLTFADGWAALSGGGDDGALLAAFEVARMAVLAVGWYLLAVTCVSAASQALRWRRGIAFGDRLTLPLLRPLLRQVVNLGVVTATMLPPAVPVAAAPIPPTAAIVQLAPAASGLPLPLPPAPDPARQAQPAPQAPDDAVRRRSGHERHDSAPLVRHGGTHGKHARSDRHPQPRGIQPSGAASAPRAGSDTWRVAPGDHFWGIAERVVAGPDHETASEAQVRRYWLALIDANRQRLADPANPDLLFPGQVLDLPRVPVRRR